MPSKEYDRDPGDEKDVTVLAWALTKKEWSALKGAVIDPDGLCSSYQEWMTREKREHEKHDKNGYKVVTVPIDIPAMLAWCKKESLPVSLKSVAKFVLKSGQRRTQ